MERSHIVQNVSSGRQGVNDTKGYSVCLKGEIKNGTALQPSAGNAEGCGKESQICTAVVRKGEWK